ncbi:MAG: cardiolipin synthase [Porphyromonadaceae bacterium]|nr:cardiolipin synthase [Porphyromonadaceae bacterium]
MARYLDSLGFRLRGQNEVELLLSGQQKFDRLFASLREAKRHIHLEYFNFRNDSISRELFDILEDRARQGVEVRILFDAFGNCSNNRPLKKPHLELLRARGVEIVKFDPITFPYINHAQSRDHRKIAVIDGLVGYVGGMNVADYYIKGLPKIGPWYDAHLRFEGEAVADLQRIFLSTWNAETKQCVSGEFYFPPYLPQPDTSLMVPMTIVDREPRKSPDAIKEAYAKAISSAQQRVRIINPYFVPTTSINKAIKHAIRQGVQVQIMVPAKSDIPFTPDAMLHKLRRFSKRGVEVLLYEGGFHHSKVMTVDSLFATVGSANLNSRSLRYDYETNAFVFDQRLTAELDTMFMTDRAFCVPMNDDYWRKRSLWRKAVGWFANLFTPFL